MPGRFESKSSVRKSVKGIKQKMSSMRERYKKDPVTALLVSDIHLSHTPPVSRSAESSWYKTQANYLTQLSDLLPEWDTPIICAGDVFNSWNPPAELINFALEYLPEMYAIPGQHDLPLHNYNDIEKSAFWSMVMTRKINLIPPYTEDKGPLLLSKEKIALYGFPWKHDMVPCLLDERFREWKNVAVVHSFIWNSSKNSYPGAPVTSKVSFFLKKLKGYSHAVFGDNHKGFLLADTKPQILNCGGFTCRNSDEKERNPFVGLLHRSGKISRHYLDCTKDVWIDSASSAIVESAFSAERFLKELNQLTDSALDFFEAVKKFLMINKVSKDVESIIMKCLERRDG